MTKRSGSYYRAKKAIRGMSRTSRKRMISTALGCLNPRGRKRGGKAFTKARKGRHWERAVSSSLPHWVNPKRKSLKARAARAIRMVDRHHTGITSYKSRTRKKWLTKRDRALRQVGRGMRNRNPMFRGTHIDEFKPRPHLGREMMELAPKQTDMLNQLCWLWSSGKPATGYALIEATKSAEARHASTKDFREKQTLRRIANKLRALLGYRGRSVNPRRKSRR
jgi:hypothetical protein